MYRFFMWLLCVAVIATGAHAQTLPVPSQMAFQGRLAKPDGTPVADGNYTLRFSLFDAPTIGHERWRQTHNTVSVSKGVFSVLLSSLPASAFDDRLWLEIQVGNDLPLSPRQPLNSVAYAFKANTVPDGAITADKIADGTITLDKLTTTLQQSLNAFQFCLSYMGKVATPYSPGKALVSGSYAYVPCFAETNFIILNISDPANMSLTGSLQVTGVGGGEDVALYSHYAYLVGDARFGPDNFAVIDIADPAAPVKVKTISTGASRSWKIKSVGKYACLLGYDERVLQVFDLSAPADPVKVGQIGTDAGPTDLLMAGDYVYVCCRDAKTLQTFRISDPANPILVSTVSTADAVETLARSGSYLYVLNRGSASLQSFSLLNPATPALIATLPLSGQPTHLSLSGNVLCISSVGNNTMQLFSLSNQALPTPGCTVTTEVGEQFASLSGGYVFTSIHGVPNNGQVKAYRLFAGLNLSGDLNVEGFTSLNGGLLSKGSATFQLAPGHSAVFSANNGPVLSLQTTVADARPALELLTTSSNARLHLDGSTLNISAPTIRVNGNFVNDSDARYKSNITALQNPLDTILNLRGVTYDWNRTEWKEKNFPAGRQVGFLAQEVEQILPDLVHTDENGYKAVNYIQIIPFLVEALKTEHRRNEDKEQRIQELMAKNGELQAALESVMLRLSRLEEKSKAGQIPVNIEM